MGINLAAGWIAILVGLLTGAGIGTFFHNEKWLGGYGSWERRMLRLTHISLVGTGLLNIVFALSLSERHGPALPLGSVAMLLGAVTMPAVCTAAAFWKPARHLFFIPVLSLVIGTAVIVYGVLR